MSVMSPVELRERIPEIEIDERRRHPGRLAMKERRDQLRLDVGVEDVVYVETAAPRRAARVARDAALVAAYPAWLVPPVIRWFTRAAGRPHAKSPVVHRGRPVRGFVDLGGMPPTIWLLVDQSRDELVEAVVHEVSQLRRWDDRGMLTPGAPGWPRWRSRRCHGAAAA